MTVRTALSAVLYVLGVGLGVAVAFLASTLLGLATLAGALTLTGLILGWEA